MTNTRGSLLLTLLAVLFRPDSSLSACDYPTQTLQPYHVLQVPEPRPLTDVKFLGDPGTFESQCWYPDDLVSAFGVDTMLVQVPIDRVVGNIDQLLEHGLIAPLATIHVAVFDADGNPPNKLIINGTANERPIAVGNCTWEVWTDTVSVRRLLFPQMGEGAPQAVNNRIQIRPTQYGGMHCFCMSVDWVAIEIKVARPVLLVGGAFSDPDYWKAPSGAYDPQLFEVHGLPIQNDMGSELFVSPIEINAEEIKEKVATLKTRTNSDKVTLVTHSKGGIDARHYSGMFDDIDKVIQIAPPNCGANVADEVVDELLSRPITTVAAPYLALLAPGGLQMTTAYMKGIYNVWGPKLNPEVEYAAIATHYRPSQSDAYEVWVDDTYGAGDMIVTINSAHCLQMPFEWAMDAVGVPDELELESNGLARHSTQRNSEKLRLLTLKPMKRIYGTSGVIASDVPQRGRGFSGRLGEGQTQSGQITFDESVPSLVTVHYPKGDFDLSLESPLGQTYTQANTSGNPAFAWQDVDVGGIRVQAVMFTPTDLGDWAVTVDAVDTVAPSDTLVFVAGVSYELPRIKMQAFLPRSQLAAGDSLVIVGLLERNGTGLAADSARAVVLLPDSTVTTVLLRNDGVAPDSTANDGRFTGRMNGVTQAGNYNIVTWAMGSYGGYPFSRATGTVASVSASRSRYLSTLGSVVADVGSDGTYDSLRVNVSLDIASNGVYLVQGVLQNAEGQRWLASEKVSLTTGTRTVGLGFDGSAIGNGRVDGPYSLVEVTLAEVANTGTLARGRWAPSYSTDSYEFTEFEHLPIKVTGPASSVGSEMESTGYEFLDVSVGIDVDETNDYAWWGRLVDSQGLPIGHLAEGRGTLLSGGDEIVLRFNGECIRRNGVDGPFYVKDLIVAGPRHTEFVADSFMTSPHSADSFVSFGGSPYASLTVEDDSLTVCPYGDADTLRMMLRLPHPCPSPAVGAMPTIVARNNAEINATMWERVTETDPGGDSLYAYAYHAGAAEDTALFKASAISGCTATAAVGTNLRGRLSFDIIVEGDDIGAGGVIHVMSLDLSRRSFGSVDYMDSVAFAGYQAGAFLKDRCDNYTWHPTSGAGNAAVFAQHAPQRHHILRRLNSPNGGASYAAGSVVPIQWRRSPPVLEHDLTMSNSYQQDSAMVTLRLLRDSPAQSTTLVMNESDDGEYSWTVPTTVAPGGGYRIEVVHTAGMAHHDWRDIGTDRSDTTFAIRPKPVANLTALSGRHSWVISWNEPTQNVGVEADEYDIRYSTTGTINESNCDALPGLVSSPPGPGNTAHCLESMGSQPSCQTFYFAIRTREGAAWSLISNVASVTTKCSGSSEVICDGGGLLAGGGGGEEGAGGVELSSALGEISQPGEAVGENALLWWAGEGVEVTDTQRLRTTGTTNGAHRVVVREVEQRRTQLDQLWLGGVDHAPTARAVAGVGQVLVGSPGAIATAVMDDGRHFAVDVGDSVHIGRSGDVVLVDLGQSATDQALVLEASRPMAGANRDSMGIRVDRQLRDASWEPAAVIHPRRHFDQLAVPANGSQVMRITFLGAYPVRSISKLEDVSVVRPTPLVLSGAAHSRSGAITEAVRDTGGVRTNLVPGDSLDLQFASTEVPAGKIRTLFLTAKGSYGRLSEDDHAEDRIEKSAVVAPTFQFTLGAAYPNPSDGSVTIGYTLARQVPTQLRVYNVAGRELRSLVNEVQVAGPQVARWDGRDNAGRKVPSGVYFYRLQAGGWHSERKMIVLQR